MGKASSAEATLYKGRLRGKEMPGLRMQPRLVLFMRLLRDSEAFAYSAVALYRKVTTWPLVQVASGPKVVSVMPFVTLFSTAQATAFS